MERKPPSKVTPKRPAKRLTVVKLPLSNVQAVDALVESIRREASSGRAALDSAFDARAALGRSLAVRMDDPEEKSPAPIARELREVIKELTAEVASDADDDSFRPVVPATVRNPKES